MFNLQTSIVFNLQQFIESSPLYRKYYLLFKRLDLSDIPDLNKGVDCTGHSLRAMLRAFAVTHLEEIKTVPRLMNILKIIRSLLNYAALTCEQAFLMKASFIVSSKPLTIPDCNRFIIVSITS